MEEILSASLSGELILIKPPLPRTLRKEAGLDAKKMTSGISFGHFHGLSRTYSTLITGTEWVKCSKFFRFCSNILLL